MGSTALSVPLIQAPPQIYEVYKFTDSQLDEEFVLNTQFQQPYYLKSKVLQLLISNTPKTLEILSSDVQQNSHVC